MPICVRYCNKKCQKITSKGTQGRMSSLDCGKDIKVKEETTRQRRNSMEKVKEKDNTADNVGQCKDCRTKKKKVKVGTNEGI